jgi:hypothetical protein
LRLISYKRQWSVSMFYTELGMMALAIDLLRHIIVSCALSIESFWHEIVLRLQLVHHLSVYDWTSWLLERFDLLSLSLSWSYNCFIWVGRAYIVCFMALSAFDSIESLLHLRVWLLLLMQVLKRCVIQRALLLVLKTFLSCRCFVE